MTSTLKRVLIGVAIAGTLGAGYCTTDLFLLNRGIGFTSPDGIAFRVRPNSWVTRVTGSNATTIGPTIHLEWPRNGIESPSSYLIAHEIRHLWQRREEGPPTPVFEIRHVLDAGFRNRVEQDAEQHGMAHRFDAFPVKVSRFIRDRVVVR